MNLEYYPIKNRRGIMPILLLNLPFLSFIATGIAIKKCVEKTKLNKEPKAFITDKLSFGSGSTWGTIILLFQLTFILALISDPSSFEDSILLLWLIILPSIIIGICLIYMDKKFNKYRRSLNYFLYWVENIQVLSKIESIPSFDNKTWSYDEIKPWLDDLQKNEILTFSEDDKNIYFAHPKKNIETEKIIWMCTCCGAKNSQFALKRTSFKCDYCGVEKTTHFPEA